MGIPPYVVGESQVGWRGNLHLAYLGGWESECDGQVMLTRELLECGGRAQVGQGQHPHRGGSGGRDGRSIINGRNDQTSNLIEYRGKQFFQS